MADTTILNWTTEEEAIETFKSNVQLPKEAAEKVNQIADSISFSSVNALSTFGPDSKSLEYISDESLRHAQTKTIGEAGNALISLNKDLRLRKDKLDKLQKNANNPILGKIFGIVKRSRDRAEEIMAMNKSASENIDKAISLLKTHVATLRADINSMDNLLKLADQYTKELQMYILAGKQRLEYETNNTLVQLIDTASKSNDHSDAMAVNDFKNKLNVFADTISALEFAYSAMVSNIGPSIILTQNNDLVLCNNIERTITLSQPLWTTSISVAIGQEHTEMSLNASQASREFTSSLLQQNAEKLGTLTVGVAKERQEGLFNVDALIDSTNKLIGYITEAHNIDKESEKKRLENERRLADNNTNIKKTFLMISGEQ